MNYLDADKALYKIVNEKVRDCEVRLNAVPIENKSERKALIIEREMYNLCFRAGMVGKGEALLKFRRNVITNILNKYQVLSGKYSNLNENDKMLFIAALQAEIFMRDGILSKYYPELEAAKMTDDAKNIFEFQIKIGACENVFGAWEAWRVENNVFPGFFKEGLK